MAITQPVIQNRFQLNQDSTPSSDWRLTDATDYASFGLSFSQIEGVFLLSAPIGIIYNNTNFAAPDIDGSVVTDSFTIPLPLSSDGLPVQGAYGYQYKIRVTSPITVVTSGVNGDFSIAGDRADDINAAGVIEIVGSTGNDGIYSVVQATYDSLNNKTDVEVANVPDATADGDLLYELVIQGQFDFYFCQPEIELTSNVNCASSLVQGADVTNYTISSTIGQYSGIAPTTISRVLTLMYPRGIQPPIPDVVSPSATVLASPLYTGNWTLGLSVTADYQLPNGLQIQLIGYGSISFNADCANDVCQFSSCIENLVDSYGKAKSDNFVKAQEYANMLLSLVGEYMLYSIGISCGDSEMVSNSVAAMRGISKATGCDCCGDGTKKTPQLVIPLGGSSGGVSSQLISLLSSGNGIGISSSIVGTTVQYTLSLDYTQVTGNLTASQPETLAGVINNKYITPLRLKQWWGSGLIGNNRVAVSNGAGLIIGQTINTAFNRNFGVNPLDVPEIGSTLVGSRQVVTDAGGKLITTGFKYELLSSSVSDVAIIANTSEQDLKTYTLPANTLDVNEDFIHIRAEFTMVPSNTDTIWARVYFGGQNLFVGGAGVGYNQVTVELRIYRTGATAQLFTGEAIRRSIPAQVLSQLYTNTSSDLANPITIKTTGQSVVDGRAGAVVCKSLTVEIFRK